MRLLTPRNLFTVFISLSSFLLIWSLFVISDYIIKFKQDRDLSWAYQSHLCNAYLEQKIAGKLCSDLCGDKSSVYLRSYTLHRNAYRLYWWNSTAAIKVDEFSPDVTQSGIILYPLPEGTSLEKFKTLVSQLLHDNIGNNSDVIQYVMNLADSDNNGKVTLSEANTLWTLLHNHDFVMRVSMHKDHRVARMLSFCGPVYAVSRYPFTCHYASASSWHHVDWITHVSIVLSLLEFIGDSNYDNRADGLHMCEMRVDDVGYSLGANVDIFITDFTWVYTSWQLQRHLASRMCAEDADCSFMRDCAGYCHQGSCHPYLTSISALCRVYTPYLYAGMPKAERQSLAPVLHNCATQDRHWNEILPVRYALMFNELRQQLWKVIEYKYS